MRKYLRPILIGLTSFLLGVAFLYSLLKFSPDTAQSVIGGEKKSSKPIVSALNLPHPQQEEEAPPLVPPSAPGQPRARNEDQDEEALMAQDPFAAVRQMQKQMEDEMRQGFAGMEVDTGNDIVTKEDDKSVSYEIKDVDGGSLSTSVKNGYLTISGESKKVNGSISFSSSFHRSFPLPPNVDSAKMETISEKDRVVLRFPKKHT
ncbi:MAG: Hsp20 family protein [Bdellovibrionota bacterium]